MGSFALGFLFKLSIIASIITMAILAITFSSFLMFLSIILEQEEKISEPRKRNIIKKRQFVELGELNTKINTQIKMPTVARDTELLRKHGLLVWPRTISVGHENVSNKAIDNSSTSTLFTRRPQQEISFLSRIGMLVFFRDIRQRCQILMKMTTLASAHSRLTTFRETVDSR